MKSISIARAVGVAAVAAAACLGGNAQAKLVGDSVTATYYYPNASTVNDNMGTVTVGNGVEFVDPLFTIDVSNNGVVITGQGFGLFDQTSFNGFTLVDNSNPHAFDDLQFKYTSFSPNIKDKISITGNTISVNWATFFIQPGYKILLEVPEPATYGMLLAGLGLMSVAARRKRLFTRE
jgi:hypothetical protein